MVIMMGLLDQRTIRMLLWVVALLAAVASEGADSAGCVEKTTCRREGTDCDCAGGSGGAESLCFSAELGYCMTLRADGRAFENASESAFAAVPRVSALSLRGCDLRRVAAGALAPLRHLRALDLAGNPLDGDLAFLRDAPQLRRLALSRCGLGDVPLGAFRPLAALEHLSLAGNRLTSIHPEFFASLSSLQSLDLSHNKLSRFHLSASYLPSLTTLNLSYNTLNDVQLLAGEPSDTDEKPNESRNKLKWLDLSHNAIGDNLAFLRDLSNLKELNLSSCDIVTVSENHLSFLSNLESFHLDSNFVSDLDAINVLRKLTKLTVSNNRISHIPERIISDNLGLLYAANNNITSVTFLKHLPLLQYLDLSSNPINFIPNDTFANTIPIKKLCVAHTNISDSNFLKNISEHLTHLNMSFSKLSNIEVDNIEHLVKLKTVDIAFNKLSNVDFLQKLINLETIYAVNNSIASIYPTTFRRLTKLRKLFLSNNFIEDGQFMYHLNNWSKLEMRNNKLKSIPKFSSKLLQFQRADLSQNEVESIEFIRSSPSLRVLILDNNSVAAVPEGILERSDLEYLSLVGNPLQTIAFVCESHLKALNVSGGEIYSADQRRLVLSEEIHLESREGSLLWDTLKKCQFVNPGDSTMSDLSALCECVCPAVAFEVLLWLGVVVAALLVATLLGVALSARRRRRHRSPSEDACIGVDDH